MLGQNIGEILEGTTDTDELYKILNCDENSSIEQINAEYKILALKFHPDKCSDPENLSHFQKIQEAREILIDPIKRNLYDKWRRCEISVPFRQWASLGSRLEPTMHWAKPRAQTMLTNQEISKEPQNQNETSDNLAKCTVQRSTEWKSESATTYENFRNYKI